MNKKIFFAVTLLIGMLAGFVSSCSESDDELQIFSNWQKRNDAFFNDVYAEAKQAIDNGDASWKIIKSYSLNDTLMGVPSNYIVVKVIEEGKGTESPLFTDSVLVHNMGALIPMPELKGTDYEGVYAAGYVIERSWEGHFDDYNANVARPKAWAVSNLIQGYTTALQHMHVGDHWRVYIPFDLAYGSTANGSIPAYSDVIFDIKLIGIYHPGEQVPSSDAKKNDHAGLWIME